MPRFSIVIPVYNRQEKLQRALRSVAEQTERAFECLIVDDGSTTPIETVVDEFDDRFTYIRCEANRGCTAARMTGLTRAQGDFVMALDSDNELYPWALSRAGHFLAAYPRADGVAGLYMFPDGLHVRVAPSVKVVGPDEYATRSSRSGRADSVGVVRRNVVDEWLQLRPDYFNLDFVFMLRFRLSHDVVMVDEPWGRYDATSTDKIARRGDPRMYDDVVKFVEDFRPLLGRRRCGPVDVTLTNLWIRLIRAHRYREAEMVASWMRERGISRADALVQKVRWRLHTQLKGVMPARAHVI
jgi:glycosyltransferase involved in cell wall biosynthesis